LEALIFKGLNMNKYTWKIEALDCTPSADGQTNIVSMIHWRVNATDGAYIAEVYGAQSLTFDAKSAFINYADLTKDTVIGWVQSAMGIDAVTALQEALDKQLETLANPPVVTPPLPWTE
jgi:hypothetical protein